MKPVDKRKAFSRLTRCPGLSEPFRQSKALDDTSTENSFRETNGKTDANTAILSPILYRSSPATAGDTQPLPFSSGTTRFISPTASIIPEHQTLPRFHTKTRYGLSRSATICHMAFKCNMR
jgi:hypothetical protein